MKRLRFTYTELNSDDYIDSEVEAASTVGAPSSPPGPNIPSFHLREAPFLELSPQEFGDEDADLDYGSRAAKKTDVEKTISVLEFMAGLSQFSLRTLITTLFTSDHSKITNVTNSYLGREGGIHLLETAFGDQALQNPNIRTWIMEKAAIICSQEASSLTDRAFGGGHYEDALYLRAPAHSLTVQRLKSFSVPQLLIIYERTTPRLQTFIKAVIGKNPTQTASRSARNPNMVCTQLSYGMVIDKFRSVL